MFYRLYEKCAYAYMDWHELIYIKLSANIRSDDNIMFVKLLKLYDMICWDDSILRFVGVLEMCCNGLQNLEIRRNQVVNKKIGYILHSKHHEWPFLLPKQSSRALIELVLCHEWSFGMGWISIHLKPKFRLRIFWQSNNCWMSLIDKQSTKTWSLRVHDLQMILYKVKWHKYH